MNVPGKTIVESELLLMPDGRLMIHNLTPALAQLLHELVPEDSAMRSRAQAAKLNPVPARRKHLARRRSKASFPPSV